MSSSVFSKNFGTSLKRAIIIFIFFFIAFGLLFYFKKPKMVMKMNSEQKYVVNPGKLSLLSGVLSFLISMIYFLISTRNEISYEKMKFGDSENKEIHEEVKTPFSFR